MTWVIGCGSLFGYASLIADTRVRCRDGSTADVLQKIHPVTPHIMVGFSGSVSLGFQMVTDLRVALAVQPDEVWYPRIAAWRWWRRGRHIFREAAPVEQSLRCSLLLAGISGVPAEMTGFRAYCIRMASPSFEPEYIRRGLWASIGSGARCEVATRIAQHQAEDPVEFFVSYGQGEVGMGRGGSAMMLALVISNALTQQRVDSVSEGVQVGLVFGDGIQLGGPRGTIDLGEPTQRQVAAQPVCTTWEEFEKWSKSRGAGATGACG